jgi:hypothetical protein
MDSLKFHLGLPYPTLLQPFQGWPAHRAGALQLSSTPLDTPRRTPMSISIIDSIADPSETRRLVKARCSVTLIVSESSLQVANAESWLLWQLAASVRTDRC